MRIGKKGFTLVEIIVSLAIMTIVAGAIGAFVIAGNNSYMRGNNELTLQEEAQLTANQIIDQIIDVKKDITFQDNLLVDPIAIDGTQAKDDAGNLVSDVPGSQVLLRNGEGDNNYLIRWQGGSGYASANQVFLYESKDVNTVDSNGDMVWAVIDPDDSDTATASLLAEYVTSFSVDTSLVAEKRTVILNMNFAYQDKTYTIHETIKLRNDLYGKNKEFSWVTGLEINPKNPTSERGDVVSFSYRLIGDKTAAEEESSKTNPVTWSVVYESDGSVCKSSIDPNTGKLTIAEDEIIGNNVLRVTCELKSNTAYKDSTTVSVTLPAVKSLTISPKTVEVKRGEQATFTYDMTGTEIAVKAGVTWSVERLDHSAKADGTDINPTGVGEISNAGNGLKKQSGTAILSVGDAEKTGTQILQVICESAVDSSVKDTAIVAVYSIQGQYTVQLIPEVLTTYEFTESGEERIGYKINIECLPSYADYEHGYPKITWEIVDNPNGYELVDYEKDPSNFYKKTLKCGTNINTTVTIRARVQLDAENWFYPTLDIPIPNLEKAVSKDAPYIDSDQFVLPRNGRVKCHLIGYSGDMSKVTWQIANDGELGLIDTIHGGNMTREQEQAKLDEYPGREELLNATRKLRTVGFSANGTKDSFGTLPETYDDTIAPTSICGLPEIREYQPTGRNVYPTTTGEYAYIWAKWYLDWTKEYRLKLQAVDENGAVIAETDILIPKVDIFFPEGLRSITFNRADYLNGSNGGVYNHMISVKVYGFQYGNDGLCDTDPRLALSPQLYDVNGKVITTEGTSVSRNWKSDDEKKEINDALSLYISTNEMNHIMYLKFGDSRNVYLNRVLTIYWNRADGK